MRGETTITLETTVKYQFQSTPLMRGETHPNDWSQGESPISIHSPHARGDVAEWLNASVLKSISIHSPHARGDSPRPPAKTAATFQSTPLMRGETADPILSVAHVAISIHSPHARGDALWKGMQQTTCYFNPLPSCEGRRDQPG